MPDGKSAGRTMDAEGRQIFSKAEEDTTMSLLEPKPSIAPRPARRGMGLLVLLGAVLAMVLVVYLMSFLGD